MSRIGDSIGMAVAERSDLTGFARSIAMVSALMILLAVVHLYFVAPPETSQELYIGLLLLFGGFVLIVRLVPAWRKKIKTRLSIEALAMIFFVTALAILTGGIHSSLLGLYLLPLLVGSIVLGRVVTVLLLVLVFVCHLGLTLWVAPVTEPQAALIVAALLRFAPVLLVTYLSTLLADNIRTTRRHIMSLAETDELTKLYNMRAFSARLDAFHLSAMQQDAEYGLVMVDVNNLKPINDAYGHEAGNRAIQLVAKAIARCIRSSDIAARYGGDEFVILLPMSSAEDSQKAVRRICNTVYSTTLKVGRKMERVSISTGIAMYPKDGNDPADLIVAADKAMYLDKAYRREKESQEGPGTADLA
ncbi:MAG: GGDEF domain-containing protein [Pseudomonadota bacterium]